MFNSFVGYTAELSVLVHDCLNILFLLYLEKETLLVICQVSIDVAWSPDNIDRRGYQYSDLAKYADKGFH